MIIQIYEETKSAHSVIPEEKKPTARRLLLRRQRQRALLLYAPPKSLAFVGCCDRDPEVEVSWEIGRHSVMQTADEQAFEFELSQPKWLGWSEAQSEGPPLLTPGPPPSQGSPSGPRYEGWERRAGEENRVSCYCNR